MNLTRFWEAKRMKNNFFSFKMYREGLRQTNVIGFSYLALAAVLTLFDLISTISTLPLDSVEYITEPIPATSTVILLASFTIVIPVLCLTLFHFLNSRAASDIYHAIPVKRSAMFISFFCSIITWTLAGILTSTVPYMLVYGLSQSIHISIVSYLELIITAIAVCIQVCGGVLLAMTIASTLFSQLAVSAIILFLPRALFDIFNSMLYDAVPILTESYATGLNNSQLNLAYSTVVSAFTYSKGVGSVWSPIIYSTLLGIFYLAVAMLLFVRRKSETAGQSAPNVWIQGAISALVAFVACVPALFMWFSSAYSFTTVSPLVPTIYLAIALIVFFLYQAITAKTIRVWKRSVPGLIILIALNVLFISGAFLSADSALSLQPSADEIDHVCISEHNLRNTYYLRYQDLSCASVEFTDEETLTFMSDRLKKNINTIKSRSPGNFYSSVFYVDFTLKNGKTFTRTLLFYSDNDIIRASNLINSNEEYAAAKSKLPPAELLSYISCSNLSYEDSKKLYETMYEEMSNTPEVNLENAYYHFGSIEVSGSLNGQLFDDSFEINSGSTPRTAQMLIDLYNKSKPKTAAEIEEIFAHRSDSYSFSIYVDGGNLFSEDGEYIFTESQYYELFNGELIDGNQMEFDALCSEITENISKPISTSKPLYKVSIDYNDDTNFYSYSFFVAASEKNPVMLNWIGASNLVPDASYDVID